MSKRTEIMKKQLEFKQELSQTYKRQFTEWQNFMRQCRDDHDEWKNVYKLAGQALDMMNKANEDCEMLTTLLQKEEG